ncbi:MAG TPA: hypothetical protein VFQ12_00350, partial [Thermoleophilaceae bacterium]|nr:hypothetical protein [Thermoleophilaceae bacterium]
HQQDPRYRGGEFAQAAFLRDSLPTLVRAGAAQVFVSTRDTWPHEFGPQSPYNSEGVASLALDAPYSVRRRPAAAVVQWLAEQWPRVPHTVSMAARLTAARNQHASTGMELMRKRDELVRRESEYRRAIARLRRKARRARRAGERTDARALRAHVRRSLRRLRKVKRMRADLSARAATRFGQVRAYQVLLDAGP